jgi:hypothetical protein
VLSVSEKESIRPGVEDERRQPHTCLRCLERIVEVVVVVERGQSVDLKRVDVQTAAKG